MSNKRVAIIGAGIVGLSVAMKLKEEFGDSLDVTIIAELFLQQTLTYGAGGLWEPYAIAGTPDDLINNWGRVAFEHFRDLFNGPDAAASGVQLMTTYQLLEDHQDDKSPSWRDIVYNFSPLSKEELRDMGVPPKYSKGYSFGTFVVDQKYYLQYITKILQGKGVKFVQKRVNGLDDAALHGFDCVFNCSGLGAINVVADQEMYPIRGQVLRVKAPWMKNVWFFGSSYVIPNVDNVVLGGTTQKGNWDTSVSLEDTETILNRIGDVFPALKTAPIENIWVGLRPGRTPLRIESEDVLIGGKRTRVVHNYGHGGSGITLAMGCAQDVLDNHFLPWLKKQPSTGNDLRLWVKYRSKL